ncbi:Os05g0396000, partial [Oryza sativa Japonica Group]
QPAVDALHLVALHPRPAHRRAPRVVVTASRGRHTSMILGGFAYIAGAAVSGASVNVSMAILSGALLSVGLGFTTQSVPLYMAEIAVARYRGAFSNGIQFSLCLGALAATTVNFTVEKVRGS